MPIRPDLRHLYRGPQWAAVRQGALDRAGHRCECCGRPNGLLVSATRDGRWFDLQAGYWREANGQACYDSRWPSGVQSRITRTVLTVAHLNHNPRDNRDNNLAALCAGCHLRHDARFHVATRRRTLAVLTGQLWLDDDLAEVYTPTTPGGTQ